MKRIISLFLSIVMTFCVVSGAELYAYAGMYYENEPNYGYDTYGYVTNDIRLNSSICGCTDTSEDEDWFLFELTQSQKLNLSFSHEQADSGKWAVHVYKICKNPGSYEFFETIDDIYADGGTFTFIKHDYPKGKYYIRVAPRYYYGYPNGVEYKISLTEYINKPTNFRVSARNTTSLKLAWNKVSGVYGYQIQRYSGNKWINTATTSDNYTTVKGLKSGTNYKLRIRSYKSINGEKYYSDWTNLTTPTKPASVALKSVSSSAKGKIKTTWKKTSGNESGYQIYYSRDSKFKKISAKKTVSGRGETGYTGKNFTKGKRYYVKIRAYKKANGKTYYGSWSKVKSVKCK